MHSVQSPKISLLLSPAKCIKCGKRPIISDCQLCPVHPTAIFTHIYLSQPIIVSQLEIQRASSLPTATHELFPFPDVLFCQVELVKLSFAERFHIGIYTCNIEDSPGEPSATIDCKLLLHFSLRTGTLQTPAEKLSSFLSLSLPFSFLHGATFTVRSLSGNSVSFSIGWYYFK